MSIGRHIDTAATLLRRGELVAIPTETVYGLAADAGNPDAVLRIFEVKQRPAFDPLIVHVHAHGQLDGLVSHIPPAAAELMARFWPGPLTLVLPKSPRVPDVVTSGLDTVGVRMPAHAVVQALLETVGTPLAAPSANPFGYVSPTTAQHVADQLGERIPYILDGGACTVGVESTIIGWEDGNPVLYRAGGVSVEAIETVIGPLGLPTPGHTPAAPGMTTSHYATVKPLLVGDLPSLLSRHTGKRAGVITFSATCVAACCEVLSPERDLHAAARNLFAAMRRLDASDVDIILAEVFPPEGLGRAINDRLRRAAAGREDRRIHTRI